MDRLQAIEIFIRVAELQSFAAAANDLNLSRTLVSDRVKDLEESLGIQLLHRTTRKVSLTESGALFLERVRPGVDIISEAAAEAANLSAELRGALRVNAPLSFGMRHVAPVVGEFLKQHEQVSIDLTLNDRRVDLIEEGIDVAIRVSANLKDSTLIARKLAACRIILCASPDYLDNHRKIRKPGDLSDHPCLTFTYYSEGLDWKFKHKNGVETVRVASRLQCNNGDALVEAAAAGAGITLQPAFIVGPALEEGRLVELLPQWRAGDLGVYALYPPGPFQPAKTRAFIDYLVEHFSGSPYWAT
ncbi:MAG: LysR family transcriptional regulator [Hyphococcus sp.]|nr:MAG: LysR family transcriptional regulator [Marinicaulis sp.]